MGSGLAIVLNAITQVYGFQLPIPHIPPDREFDRRRAGILTIPATAPPDFT